MRDRIKLTGFVTTLEMLIMSTRWLVSDSMENLAKVATKLQKSVSWISTPKGEKIDDLIRTLVEDLCNDYGRMLEKVSSLILLYLTLTPIF